MPLAIGLPQPPYDDVVVVNNGDHLTLQMQLMGFDVGFSDFLTIFWDSSSAFLNPKLEARPGFPLSNVDHQMSTGSVTVKTDANGYAELPIYNLPGTPETMDLVLRGSGGPGVRKTVQHTPLFAMDWRTDFDWTTVKGAWDNIVVDPLTDVAVSRSGFPVDGTSRNYGSNLAPNGYLYTIPHGGSMCYKVHPITLEVVKAIPTYSHLDKWSGGVLSPVNDCIYWFPAEVTDIAKLDPSTDTITYLPGPNDGGDPQWDWMGGVAHPNGMIYMLPGYGKHTIVKIDPSDDSVTELTGTDHATIWFWGGSLLPDGKIILCPDQGGSIGRFDPGLETVEYIGTDVGNFTGAWMHPDGFIYFFPRRAPGQLMRFNWQTDEQTLIGTVQDTNKQKYMSGGIGIDKHLYMTAFQWSYHGRWNVETEVREQIQASSASYKFVGGTATPYGYVLTNAFAYTSSEWLVTAQATGVVSDLFLSPWYNKL